MALPLNLEFDSLKHERTGTQSLAFWPSLVCAECWGFWEMENLGWLCWKCFIIETSRSMWTWCFYSSSCLFQEPYYFFKKTFFLCGLSHYKSMSKINSIKSEFEFPVQYCELKINPCILCLKTGAHLPLKWYQMLYFFFIKNDLKTKITSGPESEIKGDRLASLLQSYFLIHLVRREQRGRGYFCPHIRVFKRGTLSKMPQTFSAFIKWIIEGEGDMRWQNAKGLSRE